jgi:membrane fusion protein (multidrug efflux system)
MRMKSLTGSIFAVLVLARPAVLPAQELGGFDCLIEPYLVADVSTREEGIVDEFLVERGDLIEKGQLLVKLDSGVERAGVELARSRTRLKAEIDEKRTLRDFTKQHFKRIDELYNNQATTLQERDEAANEALLAKLVLSQAQHRAEIAELELARAEELLKRRTIRSPITGVVLKRMLDPGETVNDRPIIRVAKIDIVNVEVIIPIESFGMVHKGMHAEVMPKYPNATVHSATVTVVDRVVDAASDTFGVRLEIQNPDMKIPGGVRCEIQFKVAAQQ